MHRHHPVPTTTHTVEMVQLAELSQRLADQSKAAVTATVVDLAGQTGYERGRPVTVPGDARVVAVIWTGVPEFPDIHAQLDVPGHQSGAVHLPLHTAQLRLLSRHCGFRHAWGVGG